MESGRCSTLSLRSQICDAYVLYRSGNQVCEEAGEIQRAPARSPQFVEILTLDRMSEEQENATSLRNAL